MCFHVEEPGMLTTVLGSKLDCGTQSRTSVAFSVIFSSAVGSIVPPLKIHMLKPHLQYHRM